MSRRHPNHQCVIPTPREQDYRFYPGSDVLQSTYIFGFAKLSQLYNAATMEQALQNIIAALHPRGSIETGTNKPRLNTDPACLKINERCQLRLHALTTLSRIISFVWKSDYHSIRPMFAATIVSLPHIRDSLAFALSNHLNSKSSRIELIKVAVRVIQQLTLVFNSDHHSSGSGSGSGSSGSKLSLLPLLKKHRLFQHLLQMTKSSDRMLRQLTSECVIRLIQCIRSRWVFYEIVHFMEHQGLTSHCINHLRVILSIWDIDAIFNHYSGNNNNKNIHNSNQEMQCRIQEIIRLGLKHRKELTRHTCAKLFWLYSEWFPFESKKFYESLPSHSLRIIEMQRNYHKGCTVSALLDSLISQGTRKNPNQIEPPMSPLTRKRRMNQKQMRLRNRRPHTTAGIIESKKLKRARHTRVNNNRDKEAQMRRPQSSTLSGMMRKINVQRTNKNNQCDPLYKFEMMDGNTNHIMNDQQLTRLNTADTSSSVTTATSNESTIESCSTSNHSINENNNDRQSPSEVSFEYLASSIEFFKAKTNLSLFELTKYLEMGELKGCIQTLSTHKKNVDELAHRLQTALQTASEC